MPNEKEFGDTLMTVYKPALEGVMSPEALSARSTMRASAVLHAATNTLLSIEGPTKLPLNFGRDMRVEEMTEQTAYKIRGSEVRGGVKELIAFHNVTEPTSAAARTYTQTDEMTGEQTQSQQPGDFAYGGSVVGPVQALDAATVAQTASGKSWNRLKQASGNNPYMHTIYDAFKADAMGYDVVLEEVNQNWLDTAMNWSYLKETKKSTLDVMDEWRSEINKRKPNEALTENERSYMDFILKRETNAKGEPSMKNFYTKIGTAGDFSARGIKPFDAMQKMAKNMASVGYDWMNPPEKPTVRQLKMFVDTLHEQLNVYKRLDSAIHKAEAGKKELRKEIMEQGYKTKSGRIPLQYYAH